MCVKIHTCSYFLLQCCWHTKLEDRPTFVELVARISPMLQEVADYVEHSMKLTAAQEEEWSEEEAVGMSPKQQTTFDSDGVYDYIDTSNEYDDVGAMSMMNPTYPHTTLAKDSQCQAARFT